VLAQSNPLAHSEVSAIGTPVGVAPGVVATYELEYGAPGRLGTALFPLVGTIDNHAPTGDLVVEFKHSDTNINGSYAVINASSNGASVASITVPPGGRVQFALTTLTKPFVRAEYSGLGFGRLALHSFVGRMIRRDRETI